MVEDLRPQIKDPFNLPNEPRPASPLRRGRRQHVLGDTPIEDFDRERKVHNVPSGPPRVLVITGRRPVRAERVLTFSDTRPQDPFNLDDEVPSIEDPFDFLSGPRR